MNNDPEVQFSGPEYEAVDAAVAHFRNLCPLEAARFSDLEALRDRMHEILINDRLLELDVYTR